ncbi:hypothetical protein [Nocardia blacklockiae]|uniref:hypothetical protein n=1 Tax=Nocardia blacklockiae TaxID=480036 RepID=UPI001895A680|nr:hypothetical protein [Nocardia blacklockiae]MBF6172542.1 hypothetical protein [Nocardia blacklockiae]
MSDEQIGFDIEFDDKTQAFLDWVAPENMEAHVRAFLSDTVPGIADYSDEWWKRPLLLDILEASKQVFGDWSGFISPENRESADRLVRFIGECCARSRSGVRWVNIPEWNSALYPDFGPSIRVDDDPMTDTSMVAITKSLFGNAGPATIEYSIRKVGIPT